MGLQILWVLSAHIVCAKTMLVPSWMFKIKNGRNYLNSMNRLFSVFTCRTVFTHTVLRHTLFDCFELNLRWLFISWSRIENLQKSLQFFFTTVRHSWRFGARCIPVWSKRTWTDLNRHKLLQHGWVEEIIYPCKFYSYKIQSLVLKWQIKMEIHTHLVYEQIRAQYHMCEHRPSKTVTSRCQ